MRERLLFAVLAFAVYPLVQCGVAVACCVMAPDAFGVAGKYRPLRASWWTGVPLMLIGLGACAFNVYFLCRALLGSLPPGYEWGNSELGAWGDVFGVFSAFGAAPGLFWAVWQVRVAHAVWFGSSERPASLGRLAAGLTAHTVCFALPMLYDQVFGRHQHRFVDVSLIGLVLCVFPALSALLVARLARRSRVIPWLESLDVPDDRKGVR